MCKKEKIGFVYSHRKYADFDTIMDFHSFSFSHIFDVLKIDFDTGSYYSYLLDICR